MSNTNKKSLLYYSSMDDFDEKFTANLMRTSYKEALNQILEEIDESGGDFLLKRLLHDKIRIEDETKYYSPLKQENTMKRDLRINEDSKQNEQKPASKADRPKKYFSSLKKNNKENFNLTISQF